MYRLGYNARMYTIQTTARFDAWFAALKDRASRARIQVRIDRAEAGHFGDSKSVGGGVSEMRIHFGAGWRVYYTQRGAQVIVLLAGGSKASQQADIAAAQALAAQLKG